MQIFSTTNQLLSSLKENPFKLERDMQALFELNLEAITGLQLVKSEFSIKSYRIDTLAFDPESKSFVIIEYKRERSYSVIDQGVSYLNLMLEHKAEFIVEYNESCNASLKRQDVDWTQSKMMFVSPSFTDFQKQSTNFKDLGIELWEMKRFEGDIVIFNPIGKTKSAPSIKQVQTTEKNEINAIAKELKEYDEEYHLKDKSDDIQELYEQFRSAILALSPELDIKPTKLYIAFKKAKRNITDIQVQNKALKLWLNAPMGTLDDAKNIAQDVSYKGHWGNGAYEIQVTDSKNLEYIMSLVKQLL